jgi:hypothetical protein
MAHRKSRLKIKHEGLAINADVRTAKLEVEAVTDRPDVVRRDASTGQLVVRQVYDKESGDPLPEGYGYRWINEDGDVVPSEAVELYRIDEDQERRFSKHEPTIGGERTIEPTTWIGLETIGEYLIERTYEIWGEEGSDVVQLYELAEHIRDTEQAPVIEVVFQPSMYKDWGIVTPDFYEREFSIIMRITSERIRPDHPMPGPDAIEWDDADIERPEPIEQESPFD